MKFTINETKLKSTIGFILAFLVAYGPEVVTWIGGMEASPKWLRDIAKGLGVFIGVLTSKNGVAILNWFTKSPEVIPLLDGSAVVQVRPPTNSGQPALVSVAVNPGQVTGAVPTQSADPTPLTIPIRPPSKGAIALPGFVVVGIIAAVVALAVVLLAGKANAQTPQFGTCFGLEQKTCVGPAVAITVGEFNLKASKFSGVIVPGVGYGVTYQGPVQLGAALYASFLVGQGQPNQLAPSLILSIANYIQVGAGPEIIEQPSGPAQIQWRLLFGLGTSFGGSPSYVKAQTAQAEKLAAERKGGIMGAETGGL